MKPNAEDPYDTAEREGLSSALDADELETTKRANRAMLHWVRARRARWGALIAGMVILGGLFATISIGVVLNVNRLDGLQKTDSQEARRGSYKTCVVGNISRAEAHLAPHPAGVEDRLPIRDCSPRLFARGAPADPLDPPEQRQFVRFFEKTHRAAIVRGKNVRLCPDASDEQRVITVWSQVPKRCPRDR